MRKPKAEYNPNPSPQCVKETLKEDLKYKAYQRGVDASDADLETVVQEDLRIFEAVQREDKAAPTKLDSEQDKPKTPRRDPVNEACNETGWALGSKQVRKDPLLDIRAHKLDPKWSCAVARIQRVLQPGSNFRPSLEYDYEGKQLAIDFVRMHMDYVRCRGDFDLRHAVDRRRVYRRKVEDICDRSVRWFGPWWVK